MLVASDKNVAATRRLLDRVAAREPGAIKFVRDGLTEKQIAFYLLNQHYTSILTLYGHRLLVNLLPLFEEGESYECCAKMVEAIEKLNQHCPTIKLSTR